MSKEETNEAIDSALKKEIMDDMDIFLDGAAKDESAEPEPEPEPESDSEDTTDVSTPEEDKQEDAEEESEETPPSDEDEEEGEGEDDSSEEEDDGGKESEEVEHASPDESVIDGLNKKIEELQELINKSADPSIFLDPEEKKIEEEKPEEKQKELLPPVPVTPLTLEQFNELLSGSEDGLKIFNTYQNDTIQHARQQMLIENAQIAAAQLRTQKIIDNYFTQNPTHVKLRDAIERVGSELEKRNPQLDVAEILKQSAKLVEAKIRTLSVKKPTKKATVPMLAKTTKRRKPKKRNVPLTAQELLDKDMEQFSNVS